MLYGQGTEPEGKKRVIAELDWTAAMAGNKVTNSSFYSDLGGNASSAPKQRDSGARTRRGATLTGTLLAARLPLSRSPSDLSPSQVPERPASAAPRWL